MKDTLAPAPSVDIAARRAVVEHKIETMHRVITAMAVICTLALLLMGTGFLFYVLIRWGLVK